MSRVFLFIGIDAKERFCDALKARGDLILTETPHARSKTNSQRIHVNSKLTDQYEEIILKFIDMNDIKADTKLDSFDTAGVIFLSRYDRLSLAIKNVTIEAPIFIAPELDLSKLVYEKFTAYDFKKAKGLFQKSVSALFNQLKLLKKYDFALPVIGTEKELTLLRNELEARKGNRLKVDWYRSSSRMCAWSVDLENNSNIRLFLFNSESDEFDKVAKLLINHRYFALLSKSPETLLDRLLRSNISPVGHELHKVAGLNELLNLSETLIAMQDTVKLDSEKTTESCAVWKKDNPYKVPNNIFAEAANRAGMTIATEDKQLPGYEEAIQPAKLNPDAQAFRDNRNAFLTNKQGVKKIKGTGNNLILEENTVFKI